MLSWVSLLNIVPSSQSVSPVLRHCTLLDFEPLDVPALGIFATCATGLWFLPLQQQLQNQLGVFVRANLARQLDHIWTQLKPTQLSMPTRGFLDWIM